MGAMDHAERVRPGTAEAWWAWLEQNHQRGEGVWLVLDQRADDGGLLGYDTAVRHALCFGWIDGQARTADGASMLWLSPRKPRSAWAATNKARVAELEASGLIQPAGWRVIEMARDNGMWSVLDGPEAGIEPEALTAALDASPAARANWDAFPPSTRKLGLTQIAMARQEATRAARIAKIVAAAERNVRPA